MRPATGTGQDHPCGCGEHQTGRLSILGGAGSSPRMRGALLASGPSADDTGIIPADAGSTPGRPRTPAPRRDHPRGCGEHDAVVQEAEIHVGSSPRMRGAPHEQRNSGDHHRIIPADAGSTRRSSRPWGPRGDHPRGCGEHSRTVIRSESLPGSSPRMRGARGRAQAVLRLQGIIPADAGSTGATEIYSLCAKDHPRGCGEHRRSRQGSSIQVGSSPRMRGALRAVQAQPGDVGIIPADAGSTTCRRLRMPVTWDHPRGCGEHVSSYAYWAATLGSSPRMRGAHLEILAIPTI